jgi:UDP-glucose 4-epimerase
MSARRNATPQKILITGGAGYIGSHTVLEALAEGHEILVLDNFCNSDQSVIERLKRLSNRDFAVCDVDIRDSGRMSEVFQEFRPDAVIHFAGLKAVGESNSLPALYYATNVAGSINVIQAMEDSGCRRIVFSSSATVYGDPQYLPIDEDHPLSATNPYGRSKLHVEEIIRDQVKARPDWAASILRYFNPVGAHPSASIGEDPNGPPNNLMPYVAQVASGRREALSVFGDDYDTPDGTGVRDYIHVCDLARAHIAALDWTLRETGARPFNLGVGQGSSVLDMIAAFEAASGSEIPYRVGPRREGDIATCYADPRRAQSELGWRATRSIGEMCESAWSWQCALDRVSGE